MMGERIAGMYRAIVYRGGVGHWAWLIHRVAGLGVLLFLALHIFDIFLVGFGPEVFNTTLFLYKGPLARVGEVFLVFGLLFHALNGIRIILVDLFPRLSPHQNQLFYGVIVLFLVTFVPAGYFMLLPFFGPGGAILFCVGILAIPAIPAIAATILPPDLGLVFGRR